MDACGISKTDYDELKKGWVESIGKPGVYSVNYLSFVEMSNTLILRQSMYTTTGHSRGSISEMHPRLSGFE